jgi:hypothetical protein
MNHFTGHLENTHKLYPWCIGTSIETKWPCNCERKIDKHQKEKTKSTSLNLLPFAFPSAFQPYHYERMHQANLRKSLNLKIHVKYFICCKNRMQFLLYKTTISISLTYMEYLELMCLEQCLQILSIQLWYNTGSLTHHFSLQSYIIWIQFIKMCAENLNSAPWFCRLLLLLYLCNPTRWVQLNLPYEILYFTFGWTKLLTCSL